MVIDANSPSFSTLSANSEGKYGSLPFYISFSSFILAFSMDFYFSISKVFFFFSAKAHFFQISIKFYDFAWIFFSSKKSSFFWVIMVSAFPIPDYVKRLSVIFFLANTLSNEEIFFSSFFSKFLSKSIFNS